MDEGTQFLVIELEHLLTLPIASKPDRDAWYVESKRIKKDLRERFPNLEFPHDIWHFLADAEIRARDDGYRKYQEKIVTDYMLKARGGRDGR
jgi:hypothetical protein